jgi:hypothetical protein
MEATVVTNEELKKIQEMTSKFNQSKVALGEMELEKQGLLRHIEMMRMEFAQNEKALIAKYGETAIINVQTGQITHKEKEK